jgi:hypothetical protein
MGMPLGQTSLTVASSRREEPLLLVRATDALRLCNSGTYERVAPTEANLPLTWFRRGNMANLRRFLLQSQRHGFPVAELADDQLLTLLRRELGSANVALLRESQGGPATDSTAEQRRLIREIDGAVGGRLMFDGAVFRLVADADLARLPNRNSYEVVGHAEAKAILGALADKGNSGRRSDLLHKAIAKLTADWRPPLSANGLILLRQRPAAEIAEDLEPALTPSQIKKLAGKTEWIEIEVVDDLGNHYTGPYRIERPDGTVVQGRFDDEELWGDYDIDPGKCKLTLPEIFEVKPAAADVTQQSWIGITLVDDEGTPIVGKPFWVRLTDGSIRSGITGQDEAFYDPIDPGPCELHLGLPPTSPSAGGGEPSVVDPMPALPPTPTLQPTLPPTPGNAILPGVIDAMVMDDEGKPLSKLKFEADFGTGTPIKGETDDQGRIHLDGCPGDSCSLTLFAEEAQVDS